MKVQFGSAAEYDFSFDWKCAGEGTVDYAAVYIVPNTVAVPNAGLPTGGVTLAARLNLDTTWQHVVIPLAGATYDTTAKKIIIVWTNNGTVNNSPAVAIDNVSIVENACPYVGGVTATVSGLTAISVNISTANSDGTNGYTIAYWTSTEGDGTLDPSTATNTVTVANDSLFPYSITGLTAGTTYYVSVQRNCGSTWSSALVVNIPDSAITLPYTQDFEDTTAVGGWTFTSNVTDAWAIGSATGNTGNSMYVSSDGGTTNTYASSNSYIYASTIVAFGNGAQYSLSFDWKGLGESCCDKFSVYAMPFPATLPTSAYPSGTGVITILAPTNQVSSWTHVNLILDSANYSNKIMNLVFVWHADVSVNNNPPAAIDNISIHEITCPMPTNLTVSSSTITTDNAVVTWHGAGAVTSWTVFYKENSATTWDSVSVTDTSYDFGNTLTANTAYNVYVKADCSGDVSDQTAVVNFRTACSIISTLPFTENFDTYGTGSVSNYPSCFGRISTYGTGNNYPYISASYHTSGTGALYFYAYNNTYNLAVSPQIDTATYPLNTLSISFQYRPSTTTNQMIVGVMAGPTDTASFTPIDTISNATTGVWTLKEIVLTNYTGYGSYIALKNVAGASSYSYSYVDDFSIFQTPTCANVNGVTLGVASLTSISVNLSTENSDGTNGYVVAYDTSSTFDPATATNTITIASDSDLPGIITGLTAGTTYYVAVQRNCGGAWSSISSVTLPNSAVTLPYNQNFEDTTAVSEWAFTSNTTDTWVVGSFVGNTGNSMYISTSAAGTNNDYIANDYTYATAVVDFGDASQYSFSFDWKAVGESCCDKLSVYATPITLTEPTSAYPTGVGVHTLLAPTNQSSAWTHATLVLDSATYANQLMKIMFVWHSDGSVNTSPAPAIDNISIQAITCPRPSNLAVVDSTITTTDATISWHETGLATSWRVYYKTSAATVWDSVDATDTTYTFNTLNASTSYNVVVKALCGSDDESMLTPSISFATRCGIVSTFPWSEGFENAWVAAVAPGNAAAPMCWTNVNLGAGASNYWQRSTLYSHSGNANAAMYTDNSNHNNDWLITPQIALTGNEKLTFYTMNYSSTTSELDEISVWISDEDSSITVPTGANDSLAHFTRLMQMTIPTGNWTKHEINLSQYSGNRYIAFVRMFTPDDGWDLRIDDVSIDTIPDCGSPTVLIASNIATTSANLSWGVAHETDAAWRLYYKATTDTVWDSVEVSENPYTLSNLAAATTYNCYVVTDCGSNVSDSSNHITFTTECNAITVLPYTENFDTYGTGSSLYPTCWRRTGTYVSSYNNYPYISTSYYTSGTSALYFYAYNNTYNVAVSPQIDTTVYPLNTLSVSFQYRTVTANDKLIVGVMASSTDTASFMPIDTLTNSATGTWYTKEISLSDYVSNGGSYIALKNVAPAAILLMLM
jgi:hypothetical protein